MAERTAPPAHARAVIIGGGVSGCSVAYHLAKLGWTDIVLLERKQTHLRHDLARRRADRPVARRRSNMTRLAKYSADLYVRLEAETGVATGMRQVGSISRGADRGAQATRFYRQASLARAFGVDGRGDLAGRSQSAYPHLEYRRCRRRGASAARRAVRPGQHRPWRWPRARGRRGARILEGVKVTAVRAADGRVSGVAWATTATSRGTIERATSSSTAPACGRVSWARNRASRIPLHACEHFYIVTEPIAGLGQPAGAARARRVRLLQGGCRQDAARRFRAGRQAVGHGRHSRRISASTSCRRISSISSRSWKWRSSACRCSETAGIHTFFNGPESFTPDDRYYLGEAPELNGYCVCAGFNSIGIAVGRRRRHGAGALDGDGDPPFDLWDVDIRRMQPFQGNRRFIYERAKETLGLLYADHFPYRQKASARGVRRTPLHEQLKARGAVFGEVAGWERANWFAREGPGARVPLFVEAPELVRQCTATSTWRFATASACST